MSRNRREYPIMTAILPFLRWNGVFEPEATHAMSMAFDQTCAVLGLRDTDARQREAIATRIVSFARRGERNTDLLRDRVLREAGFRIEPSDAEQKRHDVA